jgi:hypothetical protein
MATFNHKLSSQWKHTANLVLGLWLAVSPWALTYAGASHVTQGFDQLFAA